MGGSNEFRIGDLRVHESGGEVHVHDDKKGLKLAMHKTPFKAEYADAKSSIEKGVVTKASISSRGMKLIAEKMGTQIIWTLSCDLQGFAKFDDFVSKI